MPGEPSAVTALRAAYPDEALAAVLGTDVDDPWSPAADEVLDRCFALAEAGADGIRLEGRPGRPALLDRLALADNEEFNNLPNDNAYRAQRNPDPSFQRKDYGNS